MSYVVGKNSRTRLCQCLPKPSLAVIDPGGKVAERLGHFQWRSIYLSFPKVSFYNILTGLGHRLYVHLKILVKVFDKEWRHPLFCILTSQALKVPPQGSLRYGSTRTLTKRGYSSAVRRLGHPKGFETPPISSLVLPTALIRTLPERQCILIFFEYWKTRSTSVGRLL